MKDPFDGLTKAIHILADAVDDVQRADQAKVNIILFLMHKLELDKVEISENEYKRTVDVKGQVTFEYGGGKIKISMTDRKEQVV